MTTRHYTAGDFFVVERYPFVITEHALMGADGPEAVIGWRPGVIDAPDGGDLVADGVGQMILTVIGVFKPGEYPTRVFFERVWVDPDGKHFGKKRLLTKTSAAFTRLLRGYRHPFQVHETHNQGAIVP